MGLNHLLGKPLDQFSYFLIWLIGGCFVQAMVGPFYHMVHMYQMCEVHQALYKTGSPLSKGMHGTNGSQDTNKMTEAYAYLSRTKVIL